MNEYFNYLSEAQLTKNLNPRTLKSAGRNSMEEDQDDIKELSKKITDIAKERAKRKITADEATANTKVWGTLLNRELTTEEKKRATETGLPFKSEKEEDKVDEQIDKIVKDPNKFKNITRSIDEYKPEILRETFSGDMGKMIVAILGEGIVDSKQYLERLDEIIAQKSPRLAEDIKAIVAKLEQDVADQKKKEEEEEKARFPEKNMTDLRVVKAKKAWEEMFEKRIRQGHKITAEQRALAEKAIEKGEEPPPLSGSTFGDGIFEHFNVDDYDNHHLRRLAIELQEAGQEKKITQKYIEQVESSLKSALAGKLITSEEYMKFRTDFNEKKQEFEVKRQEALNVPNIEDNTNKIEQANELVSEVEGKVNTIPDDVDQEAFNLLKSQILGDDKIIGSLTLRNIENGKIEQINKKIQALDSITNPAQFKQELNALIEEARTLQPEPKNERDSIDDKDIDAKLRKKGLEANNVFLRGVKEGWLSEDLFRTEPRSVVDLAKWIMVTDDARIWAPDATYPLFKIIKEANLETGEAAEIEFQPDSFIIWLRNKMIELHNDNSTDAMSPLTQVAIRTLYSPVSILQMKYDKQRYFSDPNTGEIMDDLYNEVVLEAWLFGVRRNNDLAYRQVMNSDEKLFDAIAALNAKNEHTNSTNAADYYSMADRYVRGYDENGKERVRDTKVGDGILLANSIYRNIADIDRLQGAEAVTEKDKEKPAVEGVLAKDNAMFKRKGWEDAVRMLTDKGVWEDVKSYGNLYFEDEVYTVNPKTKQRTVIFDKNGKINKAGFVGYMNFFVSPTSLQSNIRVAREIVRQAVADEMGFDNGLEYPSSEEEKQKDKEEAKLEKKNFSISARRNIKRVNLDFVEINSFVEQRWNGAAARADTGFRGYDAWTKMNAQKYRERQSGGATMGPIGNPYDIPILKNVAPDMWLSLRTESNESAQEVFNKIVRLQRRMYKTTDPEERNQLQKERDEIMATLRFPDTTQQDWASNQVIRGAKIWHAMLGTEDLGFSKLVTRNALGVLQYSRGDFEKVVKDEFLKNRRYAFKSNNAINYGAVDRVYTDIGEGKMGFKEMTVAESMFGYNVINPLLEEWYEGKIKFNKFDENGKSKIVNTGDVTINEYLNTDAGRNHIFKNVCRAGLAAQLKSHRQYFGTGERWDTSMVHNFIDSLKTLKSYKEDPNNPGKEILGGESFFTHEDIEWIMKTAGCPHWKLVAAEFGMTGLDMTKMFPELFKVFFSGIVDFAA